jgi:hypothetical protein
MYGPVHGGCEVVSYLRLPARCRGTVLADTPLGILGFRSSESRISIMKHDSRSGTTAKWQIPPGVQREYRDVYIDSSTCDVILVSTLRVHP